MNIEVKENWTQQKEKLIMKLSCLTDIESMFEEGKKNEWLRNLQMKLGKTKEELHQILTIHS